jgi:hypothetical protein
MIMKSCIILNCIFFLLFHRNRRSRELSILEAIENGAKTLFDIVADVYSGVDRRLWYHAASNVRLHVDHLNQQNKLPKVISSTFMLQFFPPFNACMNGCTGWF